MHSVFFLLKPINMTVEIVKQKFKELHDYFDLLLSERQNQISL